jgi:3-oxoacyl-[acyl-carrier-protein] synthase II
MVGFNKRIVVTGIGLITPLGNDTKTFWQRLIEGKSGVDYITQCDPTPFPSKVAAEVKDFDPEQYMGPKEHKRMARFSQLAVAAARIALEESTINIGNIDPGRIGVIIGNGNGGFPTIQANAKDMFFRGHMKVSPFFIPMILPNMAAANISRLFGIKGYTSTITTACAAGTQAIGEAAEVIKRGDADVVLAGGCESGISDLGLSGFNVIKALTRWEGLPAQASKPFDRRRDGFVPAEGAAVLVLEDEKHALDRGVEPLANILGQGVSSDGFHLVQPDDHGNGASMAIDNALRNAECMPEEIDYINAHGTSTPMNDLAETRAIKKSFGKHAYSVPVSSTKSMLGHCLGGAGAIEAAVSILSILNNEVHPTINYKEPDPECDLDYVADGPRKKIINTVLSNSFGFGGQNACVVLQKYDLPPV